MTRLEERIRFGLQETAERLPDTAPTRAARPLRSRRPAGVWAAIAAFAAVLVLSIPILFVGGSDPDTSPASDPPNPFVGTWATTRSGTAPPTMVLQASEDGSVEMVMHESAPFYETVPGRFYDVCLGAPSTMTATGDLDGDNHLVFPSPVLTCNDGSAPTDGATGEGEPGWTPLDEHLQNLTFTHDPGTDTLTDSFGSIWRREGADASAAPTVPPAAWTTEILNGFLDARIAGDGAQQYLGTPEEDIPLLYATTSGASYEGGEFEQVHGIEWPYGFRAFKFRLFAGDTVVEQLIFMFHDDPERFPTDDRWLEYQPDGFGTHIAPTTENGHPVADLSYDYFDGEVTLLFAHPWVSTGGNFLRLIPEGVGPSTDGAQRNTWDTLSIAADTAPMGPGCQAGPATAEALAESIRSELDISAPVVGSAEALIIDVVNDADAMTMLQRICDLGVVRLTLQSPGDTTERMRLYLLDTPEGSSMKILAIALVAPESKFDKAVEAAAPVVDSVEFHTP